MAYSADQYKSSSGVSTYPDITPQREVKDPTQPSNPMRGAKLPSDQIDKQRIKDAQMIKFPSDLADEFYISFNAFKHSQERPIESKRTFNFDKNIILPLPSNLSDNFSTSYSTVNLGVVGNAVRDLASSEFIANGIEGTLSTQGLNSAAGKLSGFIEKIANNPTKYGKQAASVGALSVLQGASGLASTSAIRSSLQLSLNPYPVMIFEGTSLKPPFSFDWTFYPESSKEASIIKSIIGVFRKEMLPEKVTDNSAILKAPAIFEILIRPKGIARTFKKCVLTNMGVNYAPNGLSFNYDTANNEKHPSAVSLSLTFQEIEVWLADDFDTATDPYQTGFYEPKEEFNK